MYYRINPELGFRGWSNKEYTLFHIESKRVVKILSKDSFELLNKLHNIKVSDDFCKDEKVSSQLVIFMLTNLIQRCETTTPLRPEQEYKYHDCRHFTEAVWAITGRCNYRCRHCSVSAPNVDKLTDLSMDDCKKVITQLEECGIGNVTLIGGEPLLHRNFREIVSELTERGIQLSQIFTNGSLITNDLIDFLENKNVYPIMRMSFDGTGFHDLQRGVSGAEKNLISKLELLKSRNIPVVIDMCINKANLHSLPETVKLLDSYGVDTINVTPTCDIGLWKDVNQSEKLSFEEYYDYLLEYIPSFLSSQSNINLNIYRIIFISKDKKVKKLLPKSYQGTEKGLEKLSCPSFGSSINIAYDGTVTPCFVVTDSDFIKENMPNMFKDNLKSILKESAYTKFSCAKAKNIISSNENCRSCEFRYLCGGGCRAMAICQSNDFYGYDVSNCVFFKNGYYESFKEFI